ncbi:golgin subfamily A member 3-like isoform X1 [Notamacropus eugenii]|uniref:golgin subfamily A member 3-like isoform X1 n=1 Tax=Notamacropus eugenii TaxID=9315 RepID=UPI003B684159
MWWGMGNLGALRWEEGWWGANWWDKGPGEWPTLVWELLCALAVVLLVGCAVHIWKQCSGAFCHGIAGRSSYLAWPSALHPWHSGNTDRGKVTMPQRDSLLDALQQKNLDLMRQITLVQDTLHIREQSFSELQTQHEELQGRLEEYQEKVMDLEDELQEPRGFKRQIQRLKDINKNLTLQLHQEQEKVNILEQANEALQEKNNVLEMTSMKREADLVELNLKVKVVLQKKVEEDQQINQRIQAFMRALKTEKANVHSLKEQVAASKIKAVHNKLHYKAATLELIELKKELQAKEQLAKNLQADTHRLLTQEEKHHREVSQLKLELAEAQAELQQGKMSKRKELKGEIKSFPVTPIQLPSCPVPASLLEELLNTQPTVSKEKLHSLHISLHQLRQQMDSLQHHMEDQTIKIHESMPSWTHRWTVT